MYIHRMKKCEITEILIKMSVSKASISKPISIKYASFPNIMSLLITGLLLPTTDVCEVLYDLT